MHKFSKDAILCKHLQILNNFRVSPAEDIVQPSYDMIKSKLRRDWLTSKIKSKEIKTTQNKNMLWKLHMQKIEDILMRSQVLLYLAMADFCHLTSSSIHFQFQN